MFRFRAGYSVARQRCFSTSLHARQPRELYKTNLEGYDRHVAVIGGGITGLTTAYRLSEDPRTHVTLYEKANRLGGWLQSEYVDVDDKKILFEFGPRTFRMGFPGALATLELISDLGLRDEINIIKGTGERYIFHRDHLEKLPRPEYGPFRNAWIMYTSAYVADNIMQAFEAWLKRSTPELNEESRAKILNQSLGEYLEGEIGKNVVDDLASAVIHGIYAADIYKLDARKVLPGPVYFQSAMGMSLFKYLLRQRHTCVNRDVIAHLGNFEQAKDSSQRKEWFDLCKSGSIFVLNRGMSTLTAKLAKRLSWADNVDVRLGTEVAFISSRGESNKMTVTTDKHKSAHYDNVCSTTLSSVLQRQLRGQALGYTNMSQQAMTPLAVEDAFKNLNDTVNVMVVNLYYKSRNLAPPGFGYLIPSSTPSDQNPERALGVIFPPPEAAGQDDSAQGTKIGVMMGGHWWDDWKTSDLPTEEQAVGMAKDLLRRHLDIKEEPLIAKARLQRNCIPQTRNSTSSLRTLDDALMQRFSGRLSLAGPSYGPAGLNDCIRAGSVAASNILGGTLSTNLKWYHLPPAFLRCEIKQDKLDFRVATMSSAKRN